MLLIGIVVIAAIFSFTAQSSAGASLPSRGVVVAGESIAGVRLGMTELAVRKAWGSRYKPCEACGPLVTWLYTFPGAEPLGAAVKFAVNGRVAAVFTLGSPKGWGIKGLMMGDPVTNVYNLFGSSPTQINCIGYSALSVQIGAARMSFYSSSGVIYGYALTAASQPVCQ